MNRKTTKDLNSPSYREVKVFLCRLACETYCKIYPYFIFFVREKYFGMPVNKGDKDVFRGRKKVEVRYQMPKKFGFRGVHVVSLQVAKSGCTSV
jgi:hypothetical protein